MAEIEEYTTDDKLARLAQMIDWMLYHNVVASRRDLALRMNYTESTLSCVVNGKQPISPKFLTALASVDRRLNVDWIESGDGDMIVEIQEEGGTPTKEEVEMLLRQQDTLRKAQEQLSEAYKIGNVDIILGQQAIVQKESDTLDALVAAFKLSKERMMAIIGNNNRDNYLDSPYSGNRNSFNGRQKAKRFIRKKPE